ncbi:MAG: fibronectin type III domain-containing protein [Patescibacteria group bacterium]
MRQRPITIPTLLGIFVAIGGIIAGLLLVKNPTYLGISASGEEIPIDVRVSNISDNSLTVSWTTAKATSGFVKYNDLVVSDDRDQERGNIGSYFTHIVSLRGLKPSTNYKIKIGSGKSINEGQEVMTGPTLRNPPPADVIYGQVNTLGGDPADGALVYVQIPGIVPQVALVKASGSWVIPLSLARTTDLTSFAPYDPQTSQINLFVQAGPLGTSTKLLSLADARPVPPIILGESRAESRDVQSPVLETETKSKFTESSLDPSASIKESKIKLNSIKPRVEGEAPAGSQINIEVNSENQIKATVKADSLGKFNYKIPEGLEPGEHTITVSTLVDGVMQKVTKSFIVEAAATGTTTVPNFTATPSAKLKPSPTPTPVPRVAYPAETDQPKSGNFEFSLLLLAFGAILISAGVINLKFKNYYG